MEVNQIFDVLPAEILCYVFQYLRIKDALVVSEVCKYFRELVSHTQIYDYDNEFEVNDRTNMILNCPSYRVYSDINDFITRSYLINAASLDMSNIPINVLPCLLGVRYLDISGTLINSISSTNIPEIEDLNLSRGSIVEYNSLKLLPKLRSLKINSCPNNVKVVEGLTNLERLSVNNFKGEESLNLSGLKNLKYLCIGMNPKNRIVGFEVLDGLEEIEITFITLKYGKYSRKVVNMKNLKKVKIILDPRDFDPMGYDFDDLDEENEEGEGDEEGEENWGNYDMLIKKALKKLVPEGCEIETTYLPMCIWDTIGEDYRIVL